MGLRPGSFSSVFFFCSLLLGVLAADANDEKMYIVYMGSSRETEREELLRSHVELLSSVLGSHNQAQQSLVHSYTYAFAGFSAVLSTEQADALAEEEGVISVFPDHVLELHTTQSWDFLQMGLGMPGGSLPNPSSGQDVIIGLLDTGIWPEAASFNDEGIGPVPSRWKGECMRGRDFNVSNCNRKLIGARYYDKGSFNTQSHTARDGSGHGTHTASIAGGRTVTNANYYGLANGTARGGSPLSRIAIYRVCTVRHGCQTSQILAAFDDAVNDGVDVLSVSIGLRAFLKVDYVKDPIAIGAFHATQKGILVVSSAGNEGPDPQTVVNTAPWIFTVGATTINREFGSNVILGNGKIIQGEAITFSNLSRSAIYPLVYAGSIPSNSSSPQAASTCEPSSLDASKVKGNIVICLNDDLGASFKSNDIRDMGGRAMILVDDKEKSVATDYGTFPSTTVSTISGKEILSYINSTRKSTATITSTEVIRDYKPAPVVAFMSSRGPGQLTQNILKPDISAPGVNILAAWIPTDPSSDTVPAGMKPSSFKLLTGTSMSTPHVSGAAAFLKSKNPNWSSSALRSALITTATTMNNMGNPITNDTDSIATPFEMGAGEVNPVGGLQPGLVYETTVEDYYQFLCNYGLDPAKIKTIAGNNSYKCPSDAKSDLISNMNYPSIAIATLDAKGTASVRRTVTNVSPEQESTYKVSIDAPGGLNVKVSPETLAFSKTLNKLSFQVTFTPSNVATKGYAFGSITWADGRHNVRSPFAVNIV